MNSRVDRQLARIATPAIDPHQAAFEIFWALWFFDFSGTVYSLTTPTVYQKNVVLVVSIGALIWGIIVMTIQAERIRQIVSESNTARSLGAHIRELRGPLIRLSIESVSVGLFAPGVIYYIYKVNPLNVRAEFGAEPLPLLLEPQMLILGFLVVPVSTAYKTFQAIHANT